MHLEVISGGKSENPGQYRAVDKDGVEKTVECSGGLLIRFDDSEIFKKLQGIGVVSADVFPPELLMIVLKIAMDSQKS